MSKIADELQKSASPFQTGWQGIICRAENSYPLNNDQAILNIPTLHESLLNMEPQHD